MALANFIDRAATSASQVLEQFQLEPFLSRLRAQVVGIAFDAEAVYSVEGRATLDLTIRLLTRIYPKIAIVPIGEDASSYAAGIYLLALAINPEIELLADADMATVAVAVGASIAPFGCRVFYIGSHNWRARLSDVAPVGSGDTGNPIGAGAAACFGAANVFRTIFSDQLTHGDADKQIDLSLLTFSAVSETIASDRSSGSIDVGEVHLVGAGAIGNGFLWSFGRWPAITGVLHVVDHEDLDLTNLQRYVLGDQAGVGCHKVDIAAAHLASSDLLVQPHRTDWSGYLAGRANWRFDRIAVALDSARDRIAVQGSLPKWVANAWTQETDLGVSRHVFGEGACLSCLYMPAGKVKDQDEIVADELGMPEAKLEVRTLLQVGTPVDASFVGRVATALGVPFDAFAQFVGQPVAAFHRSAICGGLVLKLTGGTAKVKTVVPMSFQSALAGILLAAEVVRNATGMAPAPTTSTRINLLRPLAPYLHDPKARDSSGRCICADADFLNVYSAKYGLS